MALIALGLVSTLPSAPTVNAAEMMRVGRAWMLKHRLPEPTPEVAGEVGYLLALVGPSAQLLAHAKTRLQIPESPPEAEPEAEADYEREAKPRKRREYAKRRAPRISAPLSRPAALRASRRRGLKPRPFPSGASRSRLRARNAPTR